MIENIKKGMTIFVFRSIHDPIEEAIIEDNTIQETIMGKATSNPKPIKVLNVYIGNII